MSTRLIQRGSPPCRNLVIVVAHKGKRSRKTKRQGFLTGMIKLAVFVYWFASFVLIILEIYEIFKNW